MAFNTQKAIEKGLQALGTTGSAAAAGAVLGYGLPGAVKELRGQEQILAHAAGGPASPVIFAGAIRVRHGPVRIHWFPREYTEPRPCCKRYSMTCL